MSKQTEPLYATIDSNGDDTTFGTSLEVLKKNLRDDYNGSLDRDQPMKLPLYKFVGYVTIVEPSSSIVVTFPKGA